MIKMPIKIDGALPSKKILESENIFVITNKFAARQDIRPIKIIILNLMPIKSETETHLLRLLSNSPIQVDIELLQMVSHKSINTSSEYLNKFYKTFNNIKALKYDGMIITGAPVETLDFEQVDYWKELCNVMEWSKHNVYSSFHICWGAQAALYYHYSIPKTVVNNKISGVYQQKVIDIYNPLVRGFDEIFSMPHSRYSNIDTINILKNKDLNIIANSKEVGASIISNKNGRQIFITGHLEYQKETLANEYFRDIKRGLNPLIPKNYFPQNDPSKSPIMSWNSHANLLFSNWLNYFVYQATPYDISKI